VRRDNGLVITPTQRAKYSFSSIEKSLVSESDETSVLRAFRNDALFAQANTFQKYLDLGGVPVPKCSFFQNK
jgi:hypothetical protein